MKLDDATLLTLDLNADSGRRTALRIAAGEAGAAPTLAFDPELDLSIGTHFAPLAAAGEDVAGHLLDEVYRIDFDGSGPTAQPIAPDYATGTPGALAIRAGELRISSTAAASPVVVSTGQCLFGDDLVTAGEHPVLGGFAVGACP